MAQCLMSLDKWFDPSLVIGGQGWFLVIIDANLQLPTQTGGMHAAPWVTSMVSVAKECTILEWPNGMSDDIHLGASCWALYTI